MKTQEDLRTAPAWQRQGTDTFPQAPAGIPGARTWKAPPAKRPNDRAVPAAAPSQGAATRVQPCPDRIWWFGVLLGAPLMFSGFVLTITLIGAPLGIPLWAAGLGLMLSPRPCRD